MPRPKLENAGKTVAAHCDNETVIAIDKARFTRNKSESFIVAEAIRYGLPLVEEKFPATRTLPETWNGSEKLPK